ncbi:glycosyltransferase [Rhodomicrobium sp. Az07]|uniref:glycosyltransferase n=1 Tax=Rhodomicrobium sp. Az07 TaxID=2839034 RepID=UPI001BE5DBCD|nr:glycosyltransferase [Rhodomicrobium sp. Az07]MBT3069768.1 glycosyltransferase [Rhodomicrobium sp. Az07]
MKIAYVTEWSPFAPTGVLRKMLGQISSWKAAGHEAHIFSLTPLHRKPGAFEFDRHGEIIGCIRQDHLERFRHARLGFVNKLLSAPTLAGAVGAYRPDVIYYRQNGPWYPGIGAVLRLAPTVAELNGNIAQEVVWGRANALYRSWTQGRLWRHVHGFVSVSYDIASEYRQFGKPIAVIPNSMWGPPQLTKASANMAPAFVFVGSQLADNGAWHGVDKIMRLARAMPASRFNIVGLTRADTPDLSPPPNVFFHGPLFGEQLEAIYRNSDVGIGTLALHRRFMDTNSALKPLEYLMYGLPVILGYRETEERLNNADYALLIGNHEQNVTDNLEAIAAFAEFWRGRRVTADLGYLSGEQIEQRRLAFLARIANGVSRLDQPAFNWARFDQKS